jgi:hypothetical protein
MVLKILKKALVGTELTLFKDGVVETIACDNNPYMDVMSEKEEVVTIVDVIYDGFGDEEDYKTFYAAVYLEKGNKCTVELVSC